MRYIKSYKVFESLGKDINREISKILSDLDETFSFKIRQNHGNGAAKRISSKLDRPSKITIKIIKFQNKQSVDHFNNTGSMSNSVKFKYSDIKEYLLKIEELLKDSYKASNISIRNGNSTIVYKSDDLNQIIGFDEKPISDHRNQSYELTFKIISENLPSVKTTKNREHIEECFYDLIDIMETPVTPMSIKEIDINGMRFTRILIDNLLPSRDKTSYNINKWTPFTDDQKNELKLSINKYEDIYDMGFFDTQVRYKGDENNISLKEKTLKSKEDLFNFIDNNKLVGIVLIFNSNEI